MNKKGRLFKVFFQLLTRWAAHQALVGHNRSGADLTKGRFTPWDMDHLLAETWQLFDRMALDVSKEPTFGSRMNVQLAALTLAFYQSLVHIGVPKNEAIEWVGDVCWKIYQIWGKYGQFMQRWFHTDPIVGHEKRVGKDGSWRMAFPFNPPGYRARYQPMKQGIGFDVIRCPVAEFFQQHGASDLGVHTWCMLDYPLAEMIHLQLNRTQTLAGGGPVCDFRWLRTKHQGA